MEEIPEPLKRLVKRVSRAFFQTSFIVVMDQLCKVKTISDEELSETICLSPREVHKICGALKEARMLKTFQRNEPKKADQRPVPKTYYYIDWQQFVNVIKWKIYRIRAMVDDKMKNEMELKGYICRMCQKTYSPLVAPKLYDPLRAAFICEDCDNEIDRHDNADNVQGSQKLHGKFMEQSQPIIDLLKDIDKLRIPPTTFNKIGSSSTSKGNLQTPEAKEDADVQEAANQTGDIVLIFQDDNEATKREKEAEIEKKRQQNALPAWHARSTVSGEAMIAETAQKTVTEQVKEETNEVEVEHAKKKNERENYYAAYYEQYHQDSISAVPSEVNDEEEFDVGIEEEQFVNGEEDEFIAVGDEEYDALDDDEAVVNGNGYIDESDEFNEVELEEDLRESKRPRTDL